MRRVGLQELGEIAVAFLLDVDAVDGEYDVVGAQTAAFGQSARLDRLYHDRPIAHYLEVVHAIRPPLYSNNSWRIEK